MYDFVFVQELQADQDVSDKELCFSFIKATSISYVVT